MRFPSGSWIGIALVALFLLLQVGPSPAPVGARGRVAGLRVHVAGTVSEMLSCRDAGLRSDTVSVVDPAQRELLMKDVQIDGAPYGVSMSDYNDPRVFVTNPGNDTVSAIDISQDPPAVKTLEVGRAPRGVAVSQEGARIRVYVTNLDVSTLSVIDASSDTLRLQATVPVGRGPSGVAVTPDGKQVYVANSFDGTVSLIDTAGTSPVVLGAIVVGRYPHGVAVTRDGGQVYVTNLGDDSISVIDTGARRVVDVIRHVRVPNGLAVSRSGTDVYATSQFYQGVSVISRTANRVVGQVPGAGNSSGIAISPDGQWLYVTHMGEDTLSIIQTATRKVVARVPVGACPVGVAINSKGDRVCVANSGSGTVSVIAPPTQNEQPVVAIVPVEAGPKGVGVCPDGTRVYVASDLHDPNQSRGILSIIDPAAGRVVAVARVGQEPTGVAVNRDGSRVYVSHAGSDFVSVVDPTTRQEVRKVRGVRASNSEFSLGESADGSWLCVTGRDPATQENSVWVIDIDGATERIIRRVRLAIPGYSVALSPNRTHIYVTHAKEANSVSVITPEENWRLDRVDVGPRPAGVVVSPGGHRVYVANQGGRSISVIDAECNRLLADETIHLDFAPVGVAMSRQDDTHLYVSCDRAHTLLAIELADGKQTAFRLGVGRLAGGLAVHP